MPGSVSTVVSSLEETRKLLFKLLEQGSFPFKIGLASDSAELFEMVDLLISLDLEYHCWPVNFSYVIQGDNPTRGEEAGILIDMHMIKTGRIKTN
jgi:hypothetical protein